MQRRRSLGLALLVISMVLPLVAAGGCGRLEFSEPGADGGNPQGDLKLAYPFPGSYFAVTGETTLTVTPERFEGVKALTIAPPLPAGLMLDEVTGVISGKPTATADRVKYTLTATGASAEVTASVDIYLTSLYGWTITLTADEPDGNGGVGDCYATAAMGCTLRAAVDTANLETTPKLLLLPPGDVIINAPITPIKSDLVIVGSGTYQTVLTPKPVLDPSHSLLISDRDHVVRLENLTVRDFSPATGSAVDVVAGTFEAFKVEFLRNKSKGGGVLGIGGGAQARFEEVSFVDNQATDPGQGGVINALGRGTKVVVSRSTASGNKAKFGSFSYLAGESSLELVNSSLVGNYAFVDGTLAAAFGHHFVTNSTIAFNRSEGSFSAGLYANENESLYTLRNSLIAHNKNLAGALLNCERRPTTAAPISSTGGNLFDGGAGSCAASLTGPGDELMTDPLFESTIPLVRDSFMKTMPIQARSKALGRGVGQYCPSHDQRGVKRKLDGAGNCDSGAFELE